MFQFYDVKSGHKSLLKMDRSATCLFGIRNYGVDINGYVRHPTRGLCIWLQQRSDTKQTWPGKWDNMVGGGLSVGYGIEETAIKEAAEEASIPSELVKNIVSAGCVSFLFESNRGIFPNTEFIFDLELPIDFEPTNADGEVQAFQLLPAKECLEKVFSPEFKTTSCPVVIDFLIRHGVITPENGMKLHILGLIHPPVYNNFLFVDFNFFFHHINQRKTSPNWLSFSMFHFRRFTISDHQLTMITTVTSKMAIIKRDLPEQFQ